MSATHPARWRLPWRGLFGPPDGIALQGGRTYGSRSLGGSGHAPDPFPRRAGAMRPAAENPRPCRHRPTVGAATSRPPGPGKPALAAPPWRRGCRACPCPAPPASKTVARRNHPPPAPPLKSPPPRPPAQPPRLRPPRASVHVFAARPTAPFKPAPSRLAHRHDPVTPLLQKGRRAAAGTRLTCARRPGSRTAADKEP